ncbi:MAG: hypothetical protein KatS3mg081_0008 [Gemmatimonadales bacterium]|nr:MAG: hypothetical protein KatS3mg081_0008 [Gemmatimonadales bacterium]
MVAEVARLRVMDEVERAGNISQRALARRLGMAVGAVNRHLRFLIRQGYLQVVDSAVRPFAYRLTAAGCAYRQRMRHGEYERVAEELSGDGGADSEEVEGAQGEGCGSGGVLRSGGGDGGNSADSGVAWGSR